MKTSLKAAVTTAVAVAGVDGTRLSPLALVSLVLLQPSSEKFLSHTRHVDFFQVLQILMNISNVTTTFKQVVEAGHPFSLSD